MQHRKRPISGVRESVLGTDLTPAESNNGIDYVLLGDQSKFANNIRYRVRSKSNPVRFSFLSVFIPSYLHACSCVTLYKTQSSSQSSLDLFLIAIVLLLTPSVYDKYKGSSIKDVLAKTDFLDTHPPLFLTSAIWQTPPPVGRQIV